MATPQQSAGKQFSACFAYFTGFLVKSKTIHVTLREQAARAPSVWSRKKTMILNIDQSSSIVFCKTKDYT